MCIRLMKKKVKCPKLSSNTHQHITKTPVEMPHRKSEKREERCRLRDFIESFQPQLKLTKDREKRQSKHFVMHALFIKTHISCKATSP